MFCVACNIYVSNVLVHNITYVLHTSSFFICVRTCDASKTWCMIGQNWSWSSLVKLQENHCKYGFRQCGFHNSTVLNESSFGSLFLLVLYPAHGTDLKYNFKVHVLCQTKIFCHQLTQNTTTDFVRFTKIFTNCSEIQSTRFASFEL